MKKNKERNVRKSKKNILKNTFWKGKITRLKSQVVFLISVGIKASRTQGVSFHISQFRLSRHLHPHPNLRYTQTDDIRLPNFAYSIYFSLLFLQITRQSLSLSKPTIYLNSLSKQPKHTKKCRRTEMPINGLPEFQLTLTLIIPRSLLFLSLFQNYADFFNVYIYLCVVYELPSHLLVFWE